MRIAALRVPRAGLPQKHQKKKKITRKTKTNKKAREMEEKMVGVQTLSELWEIVRGLGQPRGCRLNTETLVRVTEVSPAPRMDATCSFRRLLTQRD